MDSDYLHRRAGNRALQFNPPNADINLGRWGSNWGWAVYCVMALSLLSLLIWSTTVARNKRTFHYLFAAVLAISTISWFSLASGLGSTPITVQFLRNSPFGGGFGGYPTRQIYYARYIDWTLTTPLILLSLLLITGLPLSVIFITLFFNLLMITCGLMGALTRSRYKWGYFVFACAALGYVLYHVFASGLRSARRLGGGFERAFLSGSILLAFIWPLYPVCWALSEGGNVIGVSSEFLWYGLLDLLSKPVFAFLLLHMLRKCDYDALQLQSGKVSEHQMAAREYRQGQIEEKTHEGVGAAPVHDTAATSVAPFEHVPSPHAAPPTAIPQTVMTPVPST
ncbi:related to YRO2 - strong similarity to HSP30 heat shock protein Yro1p [Melanopsichium pennsylvanicum]|uniref:Related to YRO2 - strong similarity to HSP30 heat shock protein Yro1p n=2 Tax=Melanopsichium pennsylvanicum TaxID=63383 RepID=A0AAJ4XQZ8_9BASI|nr:related to YRO2-strong similarity to HSP30 heat shock protein Yro1p [Melanopsichium pennsylvanicum 4]SNX86346.1 related to YRO2 - strong similarity to HSP30 heat shock protein Yro1p [Melanopsichium pennsylvanicum]